MGDLSLFLVFDIFLSASNFTYLTAVVA